MKIRYILSMIALFSSCVSLFAVLLGSSLSGPTSEEIREAIQKQNLPVAEETQILQLPNWAQEIVAVENLFEQNAQKPIALQRWKTPGDKANYLMRLADTVENKHLQLEDNALLKDTVRILEDALIEVRQEVNQALQSQIMQKLIQLLKVLESRGIIQPDQPMGITAEPPEAIGPPPTADDPGFVAEPTEAIGPPGSAPGFGQTGTGGQGIIYDPNAPTHTEEGHVIYY